MAAPGSEIRGADIHAMNAAFADESMLRLMSEVVASVQQRVTETGSPELEQTLRQMKTALATVAEALRTSKNLA
jgi:hypothetical protein